MTRFKDFCNILMNKNEMSQIMGAFDGENTNKIYNSIVTQDDKFYILSVAKTAYEVLKGWDLKKNNEIKLFINDISNSFYYSLYMSKKNKSIIFKAPIILLRKGFNSENNNITTFLSYNLKKINIIKFEFIYKWKTESLKNGSLNEIKILIPKEADVNDFVRLINLIEGLNSFVINNDYKVWDNLIEIKKNVKIDF